MEDYELTSWFGIVARASVPDSELGRLHDWQVGGFLAFENVPGTDAGLAEHMAGVGAIAHRAAGQGELTIRLSCSPGRSARRA